MQDYVQARNAPYRLLHYRARAMVCSLLIFVLGNFFFFAKPAHAYWEHGPISEITRLPANRPSHQTAGLVFDEFGIYPGDFYCPGNSRLTIRIGNIASTKITIRKPGQSDQVTILPNRTADVDFGELPTGQHLFFIDVSPQQPQDSPRAGVDTPEIPARLKCSIHAARWPGDATPYRACIVRDHTGFTPSEIWLPAGKPSELFCGTLPNATSANLTTDRHTLTFTPGKLTLTEFPASLKAHEIVFTDPQRGSLTLHFR